MALELARSDELVVNFTLDYNTAAVARRPDKERYAFVALMMFCNESNKIMEVLSTCTPPQIKVTKDNQEVEFHVVIHDPQAPDFFARGETWGVNAFYCSEDGTKPEPAYNIPLGTFKIL